MGANVTRLIRTDHRRIGELLDRLERSYRSSTDLRITVVSELVAHETASSKELLPFSEARLVGDDTRLSETLEGLRLAAAELEEADEPPPQEVVRRAKVIFRAHVEVEENDVAEPLSHATDVNRLRQAGDAFRRRRDAVLKARGQGRAQNRRRPASRAELYERARRRGIPGRSSMTRKQLVEALEETP